MRLLDVVIVVWIACLPPLACLILALVIISVIGETPVAEIIWTVCEAISIILGILWAARTRQRLLETRQKEKDSVPKKSVFYRLAKIFIAYVIVSVVFASVYCALYDVAPASFHIDSEMGSQGFYAQTSEIYLVIAMLESLQELSETHSQESDEAFVGSFWNRTLQRLRSSNGFPAYLQFRESLTNKLRSVEMAALGANDDEQLISHSVQKAIKEFIITRKMHLEDTRLFSDPEKASGGSSAGSEKSLLVGWSVESPGSIEKAIGLLQEVIDITKNEVLEDLGFADFWYFSIVTMTTLGYGDIAPNDTPVRMIVALQTLIGLFIFVIVVATVVYEEDRQRSPQDGDQKPPRPTQSP